MYGKKYKLHYIHSEHFNSQKNASNLCFCRKICTTFTFCYQCFKFSKLNFYVWQPGIVHIFSEGISILEPFGQLRILQLRWIWKPRRGCFFLHFEVALELELDSVLHWTEHWTVFCTGAENWAEKQNFRRKKDILSARGGEIETRLRANCNSHVKNRRTTGGERKSLFWELQLYAMEIRSFLFELHVI